MRRTITIIGAVIIFALIRFACSSKKQGDDTLTDFQLAYGIGPINQRMDLKPIDRAYAKTGEKLFNEKCASCHELDTKKIGPPLRDVLFRRKPEFIMNMMLNPDQMTRRHPEMRILYAQYKAAMAVPEIKQEEARAILEFLRREAMGVPGAPKKETRINPKDKSEQNVIEGD